jgi:thiol-disulfide isomerase/thioredoxin
MHRLFALKNFSCALALYLALAAAASAQQVELLDFTSDSCPACVQMEPVLRDLAAAGAPVRRVDVNREPELTGRFGVQYLPTFIAVADGREVDRHVGATSADHLRQMLQRAHGESQETRDKGQEPDAQRASTSPALDSRLSTLDSPSNSPALDSRLSTLDSPATLDSELIASTVRLRVEDPQGISYGTGTIIAASADEAIVLTCGHLFRESQGKLPVQVELFELAAGAPQVVASLEGEVLSYDLVRDLGFVRFRTDRPVQARPVAARDLTLTTGEKVASVGCDHGELPSVWRTRVTAIDRYVGPANVEAAGTPVQGRSGGGLFSETGALIGVCFAADQEGNEGLYVGIPAIYEELDRLDFARPAQEDRVAGGPQPTPSAGTHALASADVTPRGSIAVPPANGFAANQPTGPSGQPGTRMVPVGQGVQGAQGGMAASEQSFTTEEQAALQEIAQRSGGGEVIVIIRPKSPGDRCEIFSLENPSREFLNQLTALGSRATHPRFTTHQEVPVRQASVQSGGPATSAKPSSPGTPSSRDGRGIAGWSAVQ